MRHASESLQDAEQRQVVRFVGLIPTERDEVNPNEYHVHDASRIESRCAAVATSPGCRCSRLNVIAGVNCCVVWCFPRQCWLNVVAVSNGCVVSLSACSSDDA